jgi:hypothetical protein
MPGYASVANRKTQLIRKATQGSVFLAPITTAAITQTALFDVATGALQALPAGYFDLGWCSDVGAIFNRKVTATDVMAWGTNDPVRTDITADATTLDVVCHETKLQTIGLGVNVDPTTIIPAANGSIAVSPPTGPTVRYYRCIAIGADNGDGGEIIVSRFLPRVAVTNYASQSYANGKDVIEWGVTFQAYQDSTLGFAQQHLYGGPGWKYLLDDMDLTHIVTCTVAVTTALVATTGTFSAQDVGRPVSGIGITAGTTIATFTDSTHVVMSAVGTIAGSGVAVTVGS